MTYDVTKNVKVDWSVQPVFEDVVAGQELNDVIIPISVYRLICAVAATRDFNAIHHNTEVARANGVDDMYAMTTFLLGTWERALREFIGAKGRITKIEGFRMRSFNLVGSTVAVRGRVIETRIEDGVGKVDIEMWTENDGKPSIGPGRCTVTMPLRSEA